MLPDSTFLRLSDISGKLRQLTAAFIKDPVENEYDRNA